MIWLVIYGVVAAVVTFVSWAINWTKKGYFLGSILLGLSWPVGLILLVGVALFSTILAFLASAKTPDLSKVMSCDEYVTLLVNNFGTKKVLEGVQNNNKKLLVEHPDAPGHHYVEMLNQDIQVTVDHYLENCKEAGVKI
jgi:sensor histidine kinase YesM